MTRKATCFVVQGFGVKTDLRTGRRLNLDESYRVIRAAAEKSGYQCVRADEIAYAGRVDKPVYEGLWQAELVIADLSTANMNVAYELGVRHALRPNATIVVAEDQFQSPFVIGSLQILTYRHGGDTIEPSAAAQFEADLRSRIAAAKATLKADSPPYAVLPLQRTEQGATAPPPDIPQPPPPPAPVVAAPAASPPPDERTAKSLLDRGREAMDLASYWAAKIFLRTLCLRRPNDESLMLLLSEATYRARLPNPRASLAEARTRLLGLNPEVSNNPETLRQWGTIHRRLWESDKDRSHLDEAVNAFERAFYATRRHEFASELAYLLNLRAEARVQPGEQLDAVADFVLARRMRRLAKKLAEQAVEQPDSASDQKYWLTAAIWEAAVGLEDAGTAADWRKKAEAAAPAPWRLRVSLARISRIEQFLASSPLRSQQPPVAPPPGS